ncbi:Na+/H+ antiporter NhaA [Chitinophaga sp.]|uniref:Na+/H+ antiporter NhaA n=1 Tax=Chitinophaga sp. TaxID=1869181 RepID=UPI0031D961AC
MAKSPIEQILKPVNKFIHQEFTSSIVLFLSVLIAIIWANSSAQEGYLHLWETNLSVAFHSMSFNKPLHTWINDGLMAVFFFVIGLELKREFIAGELSSLKKASLPLVAALGGMLVPALIYLSVNNGTPSAGGWGIPMATDIAFSLTLLSLAGNRIPGSVKVFLSALAVADDLGAVLVIAFFYTAHIAFLPLLIAFAFLLLLVLGNSLGIRHPVFYLILGIVVWGGFLLSGVHATIAGVLVAFTIPARPKINEDEFLKDARDYADEFEAARRQDGSLISHEQLVALEKIKQLSLDAETPLQKIENYLHPWVAFVIMPLFALANSGMPIGSDFFSSLLNPVSLGIIAGLLIGKFAGIFTFTWLMVKMKLASLPANARWTHIGGVAILAGIGFTMSLFITGLAFNEGTFTDQAKYGILVASFLAGTIGLIVLRRIK